MSIRRVKQGQFIAKLARKHGLLPSTIWQHRENQGLRKKRSSPDLLYPGDPIFIPEKAERVESCATGACHTFQMNTVTKQLSVQVTDAAGKPCAHARYMLRLGGKRSTGVLDDQGFVKSAYPLGTTSGKLTVDAPAERMVFTLRLGFMDPIDTIEGVKKRLRNLGWLRYADERGVDKEIDSQVDDLLQTAVYRFQKFHGLPQREVSADGTLDAATLETLQQDHRE